MKKVLMGLSFILMIIFQSFITGNILNNERLQGISGISLGYGDICKVCNGWQYTSGSKLEGCAKYKYTGEYSDTHHYFYIICKECGKDIGGGTKWVNPHSYENGECKFCPKKEISDTTNMRLKVTEASKFANCPYRSQWPYHANYSTVYEQYDSEQHIWYNIYDVCGCVEWGCNWHTFNSSGICSTRCGYSKTGNQDKVQEMKVTVTTYEACSKCNLSHYSTKPCPPYCSNCQKYHYASDGCGYYCNICGHYHHKDVPCSQWNMPSTSTGSGATSGITLGVNPNYIPYGSIVLVESNHDGDKKLASQAFVAQDTCSAQDYKDGAAAGASANHLDFFTDENAEENPWNLGDSGGTYGGAYVQYDVTVIKPDVNHNQHPTTVINRNNSDGTVTILVKCLTCSNNNGQDIIVNSHTYTP